jgi:hypothetical protein
MRRVPILLLLTLAVSLAAAADYRTTLEQAYVMATRLLDQEIERYEEARRRDREALRTYESAMASLDNAIANPSVVVAELRQLEAELTELRAIAFARAEEMAQLRRQLYDRYDRIAELGAEIERAGKRSLVGTDHLSGFWQLEVFPANSFGVLRLRTEGTLVTGTYRMSSGHHGSVRGTLIGKSLKLEVVDARGGFGSLSGVVDTEAGEMAGTWTPAQLAPGPGGGTWKASKLAPGEELDRLLEDRD